MIFTCTLTDEDGVGLGWGGDNTKHGAEKGPLRDSNVKKRSSFRIFTKPNFHTSKTKMIVSLQRNDNF